MQTILGSGGSIGTDLAKALAKYTNEVRLVSRNPVKVNGADILYPADLSDAGQINKAIEGSEVCYVTIGFDYTLKAWKEKWLNFMSHVIEACQQHKTKLVFFDNVYAIGGDNVRHITENSPLSPSSKKGEIRASVDQLILDEVKKGNIKAIIARAPDFFGPVKKQNSLVMNLVYDNLVKGKTAQWLCNADVVHSMGYTPDLASGTAMLGNTDDAYNEVWNLPVDMNALTGREWVRLFANEMNRPDKVRVMSLGTMKLIGIFIPVLKEMSEMMYQFDRPFHFDCSKFINRFSYEPKKNSEAVKETIDVLMKGIRNIT